MTLSRTADNKLFNKVNDLEERLRRVERHEHPASGSSTSGGRVEFHMEGPLVLKVSDPDPSARTRRYTKLSAACGTYGTGTKTVRVLLDGVAIGAAVSVTTAAATADVSIVVPALAELAVETTAIGTGAEGLVVVLEE